MHALTLSSSFGWPHQRRPTLGQISRLLAFRAADRDHHTAPSAAPHAARDTLSAISRRHVILGLGSCLGMQPPSTANAARTPSELRLDCAVEPISHDALVQAKALRRLFPHGMPRFTDIHQGTFNDCYLLAALAAAAHKYPMLLKSRLRFLGRRADGTRDYSVRLLWPTPSGTPYKHDICASDDLSPHSAKRALWVAIVEKAFAKLNVRQAMLSSARLPGYDALRFGAHGQGISALTGNRTDIVHFANGTAQGERDPHMAQCLVELFRAPGALGFVTMNYAPRTLPGADRAEAFHVAFSDGSSLIAAKNNDVMIFARPNGRCQVFYGHHAYAVLEVNSRGDFLLYNPHGSNALAVGDVATARRSRGKARPGAFTLEREYLDHVVVAAYISQVSRPA